MEQNELKLLPIEYSAIHNFHEDCVQLFDCAWVIHTFPENEMEEMFTRSLRFYKGPDIDKRKRCWRTYNDLVGQMCLARKIVNYPALIGLCLLNILAFDWEDGIFAQTPVDEVIGNMEWSYTTNRYNEAAYRSG